MPAVIIRVLGAIIRVFGAVDQLMTERIWVVGVVIRVSGAVDQLLTVLLGLRFKLFLSSLPPTVSLGLGG
jgi:hypothetical protein